MAAARFGNIRFIWIRPPSGMGRECNRRAQAIPPALLAGMTQISSTMLGYAQNNAPWSDRTGNARALMTFTPSPGGTAVTIVGKHGVPYGGFLETGTSRMAAYPIIRPTLEAHYAEVRALMNEIAGSG
jgi:hypothetical protein